MLILFNIFFSVLVFMKEWSRFRLEDLSFTQVKGGITNVLIKVEAVSLPAPPPLLFRLFGGEFNIFASFFKLYFPLFSKN
jgi:hypothetical protein